MKKFKQTVISITVIGGFCIGLVWWATTFGKSLGEAEKLRIKTERQKYILDSLTIIKLKK